MPDARLIAPPLRNPSAETGASQRPPRPVPTDLLREASRRLGIMCLLSAALWTLGTVLDRFLGYASHGPGGGSLWPQPADSVAVASVALSLGLYAFTRRRERDPRRSLDLGLGYLVATGLALGLTIHWDPPPSGLKVFPLISWTGVATIMFAAIIPTTTVRTLVAGVVAVSMNPLSMLLARARGTWSFTAASDALVMHYPDYLLVGVSLVISSVVRRLGQQVAQAREMGSYQLGELLGRGGMGEVYRATHRMLARPAAIKLIRPEMLGAPDSEAAQLAVHRFRREAEAAASLRSPHTVELYDFGVTDDQTLYFVMELLEGMTLEQLVREKGPLPPGRVVHVLRQVCASLEEAHARGLVHRDIKPANIHLGRLGLTCDFVKVLDFGLVKSMSAPGGEDSLGTAAGLTPGTPAYMAPEMALGEAIDGRADLYALGCVAYYLLTGALVFEASGGLQMVARHLHDAPVPPSRRSELPVPPALEQLVLACLAKRPEERPANARAVAHALAAIETEPWGEAQAAQWWRDHRPA